jgi:hypothetical protein
VTWIAILGLAAGAYAFKAFGIFGLSRVPLRGRVLVLVQLLPAAMLAALVVTQTMSSGGDPTSWTRVAGVGVGAVATWRRAPLLAVLVVSAATTALLRLV